MMELQRNGRGLRNDRIELENCPFFVVHSGFSCQTCKALERGILNLVKSAKSKVRMMHFRCAVGSERSSFEPTESGVYL